MKRLDLHPTKVGRRLYKANLRASRGDESYAVVIVSGEKEIVQHTFLGWCLSGLTPLCG